MAYMKFLFLVVMRAVSRMSFARVIDPQTPSLKNLMVSITNGVVIIAWLSVE